MRSRRGASLVALVLAIAPASAAAQRAGGYQGMEREESPASQPAPASQPKPAAGPYETVIEASPTWTQDRNFLGTRFWKLDKGHYELDFWYRPQFFKDDPSKHRFQLELEIGLTQRLQLDVYENVTFNKDGPNGDRTFSQEGVAVELRIAIPKRYGTIWGNPVIYLEYTSNHDAPDRVEAKLLIGGELFTPRLLGALNATFECNVNRMRGAGGYSGEPELGVTAAASYEIVRQRLRLGAEAQLIFEASSFHALKHHAETELLLGPNVTWHIAGAHLKLYFTMFFGVTEDAPRYAPWVILGTAF